MKHRLSRWRPILALLLLLGFGVVTNMRLVYVVANGRFIINHPIGERARLEQARQFMGANADIGFITDATTYDSTAWLRFMMAQHVFAPSIVRILPFPPSASSQRPARILVYTDSSATLAAIQSAYAMQVVQRVDANLVILGP